MALDLGLPEAGGRAPCSGASARGYRGRARTNTTCLGLQELADQLGGLGGVGYFITIYMDPGAYEEVTMSAGFALQIETHKSHRRHPQEASASWSECPS